MFGPVQIHVRGGNLKELFSCRCPYAAYKNKRIIQHQAASAKKDTGTNLLSRWLGGHRPSLN